MTNCGFSYFKYPLLVALTFSFYSSLFTLCSAAEDLALRESGICTESCIKNVLKKIFFQNEKLENSFGGGEFRISLDEVQMSQLLEYISNDDTWTSGDSVLETLTKSTERIYEDDFGHKYQSGLPPKVLIILSTGGFAIATIWTIVTRRSTALAGTLVMTLAFFTGLAWNWWKSYIEEYHRRVHQLPKECQPDSASWYHSVKGFIIDPQCHEYFKSPVDDPLSMVSPGSVLEATFKMIFILPLTLLASTFTSTTHQLTEKITWPFNVILQYFLSLMMVGALIIAMLIVVMSLVNREFSFSLGIISGKMHRSRLEANPKRLYKNRLNMASQAMKISD